MRRILTALVRLPRWLLMGVVRGYQLFISPHFPSTCRFHPTCSRYALEAFREYGAVKGLILTVYRIGRCHPWGGHGYDPPRWFGEPAPDVHSPPGDTETAGDSSARKPTSSEPAASNADDRIQKPNPTTS